MTKKRWLLISVGVIVVVLVALAALPFLIDVNRFRPELEAKASAALGRTVKLGNLSLSILSGSVVAHDVSIADDPAFSQTPFLTAKSIKIGIELKPLIVLRHLNVTRIIVDDPQITLIRAADGTFNFSSLGKNPDQSSDQDQTAPGPGNQPSSAHALSDQPLSVARFKVNHGTLTVAQRNSAIKPLVYSDVNIVVTDFSRTSEFHFQIASQLPGGGDATLSGKVGPLRFANVASTPFDASAAVQNLDIAGYGFLDKKTGISGTVNLNGQVTSDGTTASASGTFTGSSMTFGPGGRPSPRVITIQNKVEVDLKTQSLTITQSDISIGKARFQMTGNIAGQEDPAASNPASQNPAPQNQGTLSQGQLNLHLTGNSVPLDELQAILPSVPVRLPDGSHLRGGTLTINFKITGPLASPVVSGPLQVYDTTLVGFNLGKQLGSVSSFAGKAISKPDVYLKSMTCDTTATLAGSTSTNIHTDIPDVATSTGSGTASPDGKLHYDILSYPVSGMAGKLIKMSNIGDGQGAIPLTIEGTVSHPIFITNTKAVASDIVGQSAKGVVSATGQAIHNLFHKKKDKNKQDQQQR